jgi:uncharacterized protein (TIGR03435 family)
MRGQSAYESSFLALIVGAAMLLGPLRLEGVSAQSATSDKETSGSEKISFEVASVKQNNSGLPPTGEMPTFNFAFDDGDGPLPSGGFLSATNSRLDLYIAFAYKLNQGQTESLRSELPKWALSDRFDIQARAAGSPTKDQMRLMMRSLLADRFKLAAHTESRQLPVFAAVLAKRGETGPQLQLHSRGPSCDSALPDIFPPECGAVRARGVPGHITIGARDVTMSQITGWLESTAEGAADRPVIDRTGLAARFDFTLSWVHNPRGVPVNAPTDSSEPTFPEALRDQLGLKLESSTAAVETLVIDHIEEPSPN